MCEGPFLKGPGPGWPPRPAEAVRAVRSSLSGHEKVNLAHSSVSGSEIGPAALPRTSQPRPPDPRGGGSAPNSEVLGPPSPSAPSPSSNSAPADVTETGTDWLAAPSLRTLPPGPPPRS